MNQSILNISNFFHDYSVKNQIGFCLTILDKNGKLLYFTRSEKYKPVSLDLSKKKAYTAYSFGVNNHVIYSNFLKIGQMNLVNEEFCFIPGGVPIKTINNEIFYTGISTDDIEVDTELVGQLIKNKF